MADPKRVARILSRAWEGWRKGREHHRDGSSLEAFCQFHGYDYRKVSRWMTRGVSYAHGQHTTGRRSSAFDLYHLCQVWGVDWADLWAEENVTLSAETVAAAIRLLDDLKSLLMKANADRKKRRKRKPPPPPVG